MNDYLEKQDNRQRNDRYRNQLDQMTEMKNAGIHSEKEKERREVLYKL